ncbi:MULTISPECIES: PTS sugar transporter subunit IIA [Lactobacillus]|uniref:PTS sugar transporter subunit IIA n=1 Tax=Lactobacillus TaxID=1578 RepID=UPI001C697873|nr:MULTISPECIES: PTS glucose transporter subunit IIA [Lactobacillus]MCX8722480.1 PTS glucose transporter subunit IIA [Lactobacillus sp. B4005]QYN56235.1 PTS glucose transporter subunit IIA [Lactobacillus panisapium]
MVNLFKKIFTKPVELFAPATGKFLSLNSVPDKMFAQKVMGDGYAVEPVENDLYCPLNATITNIFSTKHAISLTTDSGLEVLLHLGIDTVELNGKPFNILVKKDQAIKAGDLLGAMDLKQIMAAGKSPDIMVIFTNMTKIKKLSINSPTDVQHGEKIGEITLA